MSRKCPHCGSYNTELKISGNGGYGVVKGARIAAAGIAHVAGGLFGKYVGNAAGHAVLNSTKDWGEGIDRHHCCNCGKDFI